MKIRNSLLTILRLTTLLGVVLAFARCENSTATQTEDELKVCVIVNKHFEVEPFMEALQLLSRDSSVASLPDPEVWYMPEDKSKQSLTPRAVYRSNGVSITLWCIQDLMDRSVSSSNSAEKYRALPDIIAKSSPDMIFSVSTAASTLEMEMNFISQDKELSITGSVLVGNRFYMFDAHEHDPASTSRLEVVEYAESPADIAMYCFINESITERALPHFKTPGIPEQLDHLMEVFAYDGMVSIGVVNVENYSAYDTADPAAYNGFYDSKGISSGFPCCVETTHGVVKMSATKALGEGGVPLYFVSPISNRFNRFNEEITDDANYCSSYNSGIVMGLLFEHLLTKGNTFE